MARELHDRQVRVALGDQAGDQARTALVFRALGFVGWVFCGVWLVVWVGSTLTMLVRGDDHDMLSSTAWWVWLAITAAFAVGGVLGYRLYDVWAHKALGDQYGELRLVHRPGAD
jgi:hypothetical protein